MIKHLNIDNIAIIEKCSIDFSNGFNCLTGETGAGKSIIIDAINSVTGQRTSKELIRQGQDKANVSALFVDVSKPVIDALSSYGISAEDNSVLVSRTISADGKNVCKINAVSVNVSILKEIGALLLNIHGQHDNEALLDPKNHIKYVDYLGNYDDILDEYKNCYFELKDVRKKLKDLIKRNEIIAQKYELLQYQVNEITNSKITVGELDSLIKRRDVIRNAEKIKLLLDQIKLNLSGDDNNIGAENMVFNCIKPLETVSKNYNKLEAALERVIALSADISDISLEINNTLDELSFDENELEELELRIDLIKSICKKYGGSETSALEYLESAASQLTEAYENNDAVASLEARSDELDNKIYSIGQKLTKARKQCAYNFAKNVCSVLKFLEMPNVSFSVNITEGIYTVSGCDNVEFFISANLGQDEKPLSKIASGGELSRIMLAIKSILTDDEGADTLIFDEIDSGISGKAADKVAKQLKLLSKNKQVICVTHLAQIAAASNNHLLISKSTKNGTTLTDVKHITDNDRIEEIARIISGSEMTDNLYKTSKELIDNYK